MRVTDTHVYFWGGVFSNFYPAKVTIDITTKVDDHPIYESHLETFESSEHAFMARKAKQFGDEHAYRDICVAYDPSTAKAIGRSVKGYVDEEWAKTRYGHMFDACLAKFYGTELEDDLMKTGDKIIVEASPYDKIWGVGLGENDPLILDEKNWKGENLLGKVLMEVRQFIREETGLNKWYGE